MKKICILMLAVVSAAMFSSCTKTESSSVDYKVLVTFNALGGTFDGEATTLDTTVNVGTEVKAPEVTPTRDGYIFVDWYLEGDCLTRAKFPVSVNSDKIYYAKWAPVGSQWRVSAMTVEYYMIDTIQGISPYPSHIIDYEYHFGKDGDLDSISAKLSDSNYPLAISFEGDSIYLQEVGYGPKFGAGTFERENGSFSSLFFACNKLPGDTLDFDMEYDESGYFKGMDMYTVFAPCTMSDVNIENGSYKKSVMEIDMSSFGMGVVTMEYSYQYSDIPNVSDANLFTPGYAFYLIANMSFSEYGSFAEAIMSSSCVGKASNFIPRTVSLLISISGEGESEILCIMDSRYTVINPLTGNVSQLGYVMGAEGQGLSMIKFKYNYEPIE